MKHIELNLGLACNHKCIFCMSGLAKNDILWFEKFETLEKEINKLYSLWYTSIWFLGWEPTIHPNFLELVKIAKDKWFKNIETITNWSKIFNEDFLFEAIKNGLTRISISLHSIYAKKEEKLLWWINGILSKKLKSIKNVLKFYNRWILKKELSINIVINKFNYKETYKTIIYLYKLWVKSFRLNFIQLEGNSTKNYLILALTYEEFRPYLKKLIFLCKRYDDIRINFEAIPWCYSWLNYSDYIKYSEQKIDKVKDKISRDDLSLSRDIINQLERRKELKVYIKKCDNCFLKWECEGIWKRYTDYFKLK